VIFAIAVTEKNSLSNMNFRVIFLISLIFFLFGFSSSVLASQINIIYPTSGNIQISNPEVSQFFYDQLSGSPRDYFIVSKTDFNLHVNLMVPEAANPSGRYSLKVSLINGNNSQQINELDGTSFNWQEYYDTFGRDYYLNGPEVDENLSAGKYKVEVFSDNNQGKYVLTVGKKDSYSIQSALNIYWQLPYIKLTFTKTSPLQFFLTPFGIIGIGVVGVLLVIVILIYYLYGAVSESAKHSQAKTLLLTSSGMQMRDAIIKLLQKPAYDMSVAFITTAAKPEMNLDYLENDWEIMKSVGFNVEEIDIEGKTEEQVYKLLEFKDIIYVEGGNTFYLIKAMRACNFEKTIKKLLGYGKVYIGASAGSIVAGKTIQTSDWKVPEKRFGVTDLTGLNIVPFDIFVHYQPEHAEIIKQKMPDQASRIKNLKIITDSQAILVQGKEVDLIGEGDAVVV
jgi:dipeptidase E